MYIRNLSSSSNYRFMSQLFSQMAGKKVSFTDPLEKFAEQAKNSGNSDRVETLNTQGIAGMCIHGKSASDWQQTIDISEDGQQELFDMVKSEFIKNNGKLDGDTTMRSKVYSDYLKSIPQEDRLKASWTLDKLEAKYRSALVDAVKQANPDWDFGKSFNSSVLDQVTLESVSAGSGKKGIDIRV